MFLQGIKFARVAQVFFVVALLALVSIAAALLPDRAPVIAKRMPGLTVSPKEGIMALAAFADDTQRVHLLWLHEGAFSNGMPRKYTTWYRRGTREGTAWDAPVKLLTDVVEPPNLVCSGRTLHALLGLNLRDFISSDSGTTWTETQPLVPDDDLPRCFALKAGVAATDSSLAAVYAGVALGGRLRGNGYNGILELRVVRAVGRQVHRPQHLGSFSLNIDEQAQPQVVFARSSMYVVCTFNDLREKDGPDGVGGIAQFYTPTGDLIAYRSADGGRSWEGPTHMLADSEATVELGNIAKVQCVPVGERVRVVFSCGTRLYSTELDSLSWHRPVRCQGVTTAVLDFDFPDCFAYLPSSTGGGLIWVADVGGDASPRKGLFGGPPKWVACFANVRVSGDTLLVGPRTTLSGRAALIPSVALVRVRDSFLALWAGKATEAGRRNPDLELPYIEYCPVGRAR